MSAQIFDQQPSEFRFLAGDAAGVGRTAALPQVQRVSIPLPDGRNLSALRFGDVAEEPIEFVLLHGMGLNAHSFDPAVLSLDRPTLSIDLAGHGKSDWRSDADYRPQVLAADIVVALDELATSPVVLVGHSLGALTAILVAAQRPEALSALVLLDITPGVTPSTSAASVTEFIAGQRSFDSVEQMVDRAITFGIGHDRKALTRGVALNSRLRPDGKIEWTHHFAHLLPDTVAEAAAEPVAEPDAESALRDHALTQPFAALWAPLAALTVPITLVRGNVGMVSEGLLAQWVERLPGSSIATLETGHNVHEQDPVGLAKVLARAADEVTTK